MDILLIVLVVLLLGGGGTYFFYPGPWRNPDGSIVPGQPSPAPAQWAPNNIIGLIIGVFVLLLILRILHVY